MSNISNNKILIVKHGALGDVVRTAYFARPLHERKLNSNCRNIIYWLTSPSSADLLRFNPYVDEIIIDIDKINDITFDVIYSLDDERDILRAIKKLNARKVVGAYINDKDEIDYCEESRYWFDMGLVSRLGKSKADILKKENKDSHSVIFKKIFNVKFVDFNFYNSQVINIYYESLYRKVKSDHVLIGINPFAGKRWGSKALGLGELKNLISQIFASPSFKKTPYILLLGTGEDLLRYYDILREFKDVNYIEVIDTERSVLEFAGVLKSLDILITADTLGLHFAVGQKIKTVVFFAPTSAAEVENFEFVRKVKSLSSDYCTYHPNVDNSSITAERIFHEVKHLL